MNWLKLLAPFLYILLIGNSSLALNMKTEDFAIRFPERWSCDPDRSVIVCAELGQTGKKSAIVIINYKAASPTDTLADFRNRLNKPKKSRVENGAPRISRVISFQDKVIHGLSWIEALHFEGELPDYYTYYLATRKSGKFFLITLSAFSGDWDKYRPQFDSIISSLQILTPEPTPNQQFAGQENTPEMGGLGATNGQGSSGETMSNVKKLTNNLSPARLFLFGAIIVGSLMVLYAIKS